jgi:hypothetical protein
MPLPEFLVAHDRPVALHLCRRPGPGVIRNAAPAGARCPYDRLCQSSLAPAEAALGQAHAQPGRRRLRTSPPLGQAAGPAGANRRLGSWSVTELNTDRHHSRSRCHAGCNRSRRKLKQSSASAAVSVMANISHHGSNVCPVMHVCWWRFQYSGPKPQRDRAPATSGPAGMWNPVWGYGVSLTP